MSRPPPRPDSPSATISLTRLDWVLALVLVALVSLVYGQTLGFGFVDLDDGIIVTQNKAIQRGLDWEGVKYAFTSLDANFYTPLRVLSHMLDCQLFGLNAGGHHFTNLLLHGISAVLLFLALRWMTGRRWLSAFTAAVFAIHPLHVESVAWISERKDTLSGVFFMLALLAYANYVLRGPTVKRYVWVAVAFVLGLLSKPSLVTLPFLLLLLDFWPLGRFGQAPAGGRRADFSNLPRLALEKLPLLALGLGFSVIAYFAEGNALKAGASYPLGVRLENSLISYTIYLGQTLWPAGLIPFYPHPGAAASLPGPALASLGLLMTISAAALALWRRAPFLLIGWLWFLGMLVPMIGLVQVGEFSHADRFMYLPQIGLTLALVWAAKALLAFLEPRIQSALVGALMLATVVTLAALAAKQASYWKDGPTLWAHTINIDQDNCMANYYIGSALLLKGQHDQAETYLERALAAKPDYTAALFDLGNIHQDRGDLEGAIEFYRQALAVNPIFAGAHGNLGNALVAQGKLEQGVEHLRLAVKYKPEEAVNHMNLGNALLKGGQPGIALTEYDRAVDLDQNLASAYLNRGVAYLHLGDAVRALPSLSQAALRAPESPEVHYNLALAHFQSSRLDDSIAEYQKALELNPRFADAHNDLGTALQSQERFAEAREHFRKALELQPQNYGYLNNLAWLAATNPQASEGLDAVALAEQAAGLSERKEPIILRTLAAAYASAGRFTEALAAANAALEVATNANNTSLSEALLDDMASYRLNKPLRTQAP